MPVLDTTLLVDLQRDRADARRALDVLREREETLVVPAQVATEYLTGHVDPVQGFDRLVASFDLRFIGDRHVLEAARLASHAIARGDFPGWGDVHVAATARLEDTYVVTANPLHLEALEVPTWDYRTEEGPPGAGN